MSGPSSVTLAVQALSRKIDRIAVLEEQIRKLEIGDPSASSMTVLFTTTQSSEQKTPEPTLAPTYSEGEVMAKLADFGCDMATLKYSTVYSLLQACAARARDRRAYESSKLTRAELDKLKGAIHSQNPEVSEAAKKRRQAVQEELRGLSEQQQRANKEWTGLVRSMNIARKGKLCETDADFDQLSQMCECWFEWLLQAERERTGLCVATMTQAVTRIAANITAVRSTPNASFSKVAAADNTLATQRKAAFAEAERAVTLYLLSTQRTQAPAPRARLNLDDPFGELASSPEPSTERAADESAVLADVVMASADSRTLTTAQVSHARYSQQEALRTHEAHVTKRLPVGSTAHCLGRLGAVLFTGHCGLGEGVWVGLRLATAHNMSTPLVYTDSHTLPIDALGEARAMLRCPVEQALFAPAHAVFPADARDRSRMRAGPRYHAAATAIQRFFRAVQQRKRAALAQERGDDSGRYRAADAIARAAGHGWRDIGSLATHLLAAPTSQPLILRARLAYTWVTVHLRYHWASEATEAEAVLREGGGNALGLSVVYRELCTAMGVDCCVVRGVSRATGSDWRVGVGARSDNHAWCVVKADRDRQGRTGPDSDRFMLVDVAYGTGEWGAFKPRHNPTHAYFDCDPDAFALSYFPLSIVAGRRPFPALQAFATSPSRTLTHIDPVPRPLSVGRYDVETSVIFTRAYAHNGCRLIHPAAAPALTITATRAYLCLALLVRKGAPLTASLASLQSPYMPSPAHTTKATTLSRHCPYSSVAYVDARSSTHHIAYVTVVLPRAGSYALSLAIAPHRVPAALIPQQRLFTIPVIASTGVLAYRSPHDVTVGYPLQPRLPTHRARPRITSPQTGFVDVSAPLHVELACEDAQTGLDSIAEVVAVSGDHWCPLARIATTRGAIVQAAGGLPPADPDARVTLLRTLLPLNASAPATFTILARYNDAVSFAPIYHFPAVPDSTPQLILDSDGRAFLAGLRLLSSSVTAGCIVICLETHARNAIHAVAVAGKHTRPFTSEPLGKCSTRLVALDVSGLAMALARAPQSAQRAQAELTEEKVADALLHGIADSEGVQAAMEGTTEGSLVWQVCCDVPAGDATVFLYSAAHTHGVFTFLGAFHASVPEKPAD